MRYADELVHGALIKDRFLNYCILDKVKGRMAIDKKTICRNTRLKDQFGVSIFVNDIVSKCFGNNVKYGIVISNINNSLYVNWIRQKIILLKH